MSRDIKNFNNGIDVDFVADSLAAGDGSVLDRFFGEAAEAEFLVPYKGTQNRLAVVTSPEGENMLPAFSSYAAFEKSPLDKKCAVVLPFPALIKS